jgi:hypothetical protein
MSESGFLTSRFWWKEARRRRRYRRAKLKLLFTMTLVTVWRWRARYACLIAIQRQTLFCSDASGECDQEFDLRRIVAGVHQVIGISHVLETMSSRKAREPVVQASQN